MKKRFRLILADYPRSMTREDYRTVSRYLRTVARIIAKEMKRIKL